MNKTSTSKRQFEPTLWEQEETLIKNYGQEMAREIEERKKGGRRMFKDALQLFPREQVLQICLDKEEELTGDLEESRAEENRLMEKISWEEENVWPLEAILERQRKISSQIKTELRRWQYKKRYVEGKKVVTESYNVEELKEIPITEILAHLGYTGQRAGQKRLCYKLRDNDKTPSFYVFEETNTFYDFGVNYGGDTIALIQWVFNCDFKEACKTLQEMF